MFRPWLRVARPDDWTGTLARLGLWPVYFVALLTVAIGRIPVSWWVLGAGIEELTRVVLALLVLYLLGWVRAFVFSLLPRAVVQFGRHLWFRHRRRRVRVRTAMITAVDVEERPAPEGEVFVIELDDGAVYDLCPVAWNGAERVYALLARRVRRAKLRASRKAAAKS
ncbi:MAG: hypothetical protein KC431_29755 [Myxococcales bacterium]|nr:hypothetical protein [Myxococcales bacterium]MCA9701744.1 hypothetical protein [Myxococcales bacterium]